MAALADEEIERLINTGLQKLTPHTVTRRDDLWERIKSIRKVGYAVTIAEWREGVCAVGAAVVDPTGRPSLP